MAQVFGQKSSQSVFNVKRIGSISATCIFFLIFTSGNFPLKLFTRITQGAEYKNCQLLVVDIIVGDVKNLKTLKFCWIRLNLTSELSCCKYHLSTERMEVCHKVPLRRPVALIKLSSLKLPALPLPLYSFFKQFNVHHWFYIHLVAGHSLENTALL